MLTLYFVMPVHPSPFLPLSLFLKIKIVLPLILAILYLIFASLLLLSNAKRTYKILLTLTIFPMLCIGGLLMLGGSTEYILDSVQTKENRYNLTFYHEFGDVYYLCLLYKCDTNGLGCQEIQHYTGNCQSLEKAKLVVNPKTQEVNVFIQQNDLVGYELDYTYGVQPRSYDEKIEVGEYDYYLASYYEYDKSSGFDRHYILYRCKTGDLNFTRLPFRYDTLGVQSIYLEYDEQVHEIKISLSSQTNSQLIYTYGDMPKCYMKGCSLADK